MRLLFASDSFKGTISSERTIELLNLAARKVWENCETCGVIIADGGEGTTQAVVEARGGELVVVDVNGPLMEPVQAFYGKLSETEAILEMASASGLPLVPEEKRNPLNTTTYGTGELLKCVLEAGIETVLDLINFEHFLSRTDLVVTGEGRTDSQSAQGKVLQGVGDRAKKKGVPVVALSGGLGTGYEKIYEHGVDSLMTTVDGPMSLEEALGNAEELYIKGAIRLFRMIQVGMLLSDVK